MKKEKKVLMISSTGLLGGGPKQISFLISRLSSEIKIYLACPRENIFELDANIDKKNIVNIRERKISLNDFIKVYKFIKKNKIDIVHSHGKGAAIYGRFLSLATNLPHVYTYHGIHLKCHSLIYKILYVIYENIFGLIDSCKIFVSKSEIVAAKSNFLRIGKNRKVIFNGVEIIDKEFTKNNNNDLRKKLKIKKQDIVVTNVCRFVEQKNIFDFLRIASECKNIYFFLIGYGKLESFLRNFAYEQKIKNVIFLGKKKDVFKFLSITDIFLSTSLYEGLPLALLEAMSMEIPIVASNVYGHTDAVDDNLSGFLYDLKDLNKASSLIRLLAKNKKLRIFLGRNSKKKQINQFSIDKMCEAYLDLYKSISQNYINEQFVK